MMIIMELKKKKKGWCVIELMCSGEQQNTQSNKLMVCIIKQDCGCVHDGAHPATG